MNKNNNLKLKTGSHMRVLDLKEGITIALPTNSKVANARVIDVNKDGSTTIHWAGNFNLHGDFGSELMTFDNNLVQVDDLEKRNAIRTGLGLVTIK